MGSLGASTKQHLLVGETNNVQERKNKKGKDKGNPEFEPKDEFDPSNEASVSKKDKHQRFDKGKSSYCKKGKHTEKGCMKKTIDQMPRILEQHNISIPEGTRKDDSRDKTEDHERFHALKVGFSKSHAFLFDSGASNHMVACKETFSLLNLTDGPSIHMGDDTQIQDEGKGSIKEMRGARKILSVISELSKVSPSPLPFLAFTLIS